MCDSFYWFINGHFGENTPSPHTWSIIEIKTFFKINYYFRYYTFEFVTARFNQKQPLLCDNFGCHI